MPAVHPSLKMWNSNNHSIKNSSRMRRNSPVPKPAPISIAPTVMLATLGMSNFVALAGEIFLELL
jgi:hypothetical protein